MELRKNGEARRADPRSDGSMERRKVLCAEKRGGCIAADKRIHESMDTQSAELQIYGFTDLRTN